MSKTQQDDDDDELFGDFKFVPSPTTTTKPDDDDDWGDFMENFSHQVQNPPQFNGFHSTLQQQIAPTFFDPLAGFLDQPATKPLEPQQQPKHAKSISLDSFSLQKSWEKPRGALPLSFFGDEEEPEEEESDLVDSVKQDERRDRDRDSFPSKTVAPLRNVMSFGSGTDLNNLIVNLYGQSKPIGLENRSNSMPVRENGLNWNPVVENGLNLNPVAENGSNLESVVDENGEFDEEDWEFKVADGDPGIKEDEKGLNSSEIQVEATTINASPTTMAATPPPPPPPLLTTTGVDEIMWGNSGQSVDKSGSSAQFGGDWFLSSNGFSKSPNVVENGFHFESLGTPGGTSNVDLLSEPKQTAAENGHDSYLIDDNYDSDDNFGDFRDASLDETVNGPSRHKEELKISDHSGFETKELLFDDDIQENGKGLENGEGALPLSVFSNGNLESNDSLFSEDVFSYKPTASLTNGTNNQVPSSNVSFNDLIYNLYSQAEQVPAVGSTPEHTENGFSSAHTGVSSALANDEDDFDDGSWEFKDASLESRSQDPNSVDVGHVHEKIPTESKIKNFVELYFTLKEDSYFIALHHLDDLKSAEKVASISGDDARVAALQEEIQAAYKILQQENVVSEEVYRKEHPPRSILVNKLLKAIKEPKFQLLESEYQLSQKISLAAVALHPAIVLFEHAVSVLKILTVGSMEDQFSYATTWSRMISSSAKELNHGTSIWKQSLQKNVHKQILSKSEGQRYILALGEIYRVVGVLRVSATLYKPWILSSLADPMGIFATLEECSAAWSASGLEEALESISNPVDIGYYGTIEALLESMKAIHDLKVASLQNHVSFEEPICRLSLLSSRMLSGMKTLIWNGEQYFLALANFWANRISSDPPKLPRIHVGS